MKIHTVKRLLSIVFIIFSLLFLLTLSGCSATRVKAHVLHLTGVMSNEDYQCYIRLVDENQLDVDGNYSAPELNVDSERLPPNGSIHVTFAQNSYIDVQYYLDANLTEAVDTKWCYLMPGDCIYAEEPLCSHPSSQWYRFDRFCIYACDETGTRKEELPWGDEGTPALVLRIPANCADTEISVVPVGKYEKRALELTDYYTDNTGHQQELSGTWIVNDTEVSTKRVEVSPVEPLSIDFRYDDTQYDFVKSNPSSFYHEKGLVRFETTYADNDIEQYSIELRSLEGMFLFDLSQYSAKHGTVTFQYNGRNITEKEDPFYIYDGEYIIYTAVPDGGYQSTESTGTIFIDASNPDKTETAIKDAITFYPDENVTVSLPQPAIGGIIEYSVNGKPLSGETCTVRCGTDISMKFDHWNGWIVNANASNVYRVKPGDKSVSIGLDINKLFTEADSHKPTLNLVLTDSIKDAKFAISTSDISQKRDLGSYETGSKTSIIPDLLGQNDREIFGGGKIGTGSGITLTVTDDTIFEGEAIKLEITAKDTKKNEYKSVRYITNLPIEETIDLYGEHPLATRSTVYESITVKASKVGISSYMTRVISHASITAKLVDEERILQDGDVLEPSREVEIIITPDSGYYVSGSKRDDGIYSETMKYSKWEKESSKIRDKHPAKKIWYVTLDTSDSYGTCVYKIDGIVRSGKTGIREGQKLTLEYTITDSNYQIARKGIGGFVGSTLHSNTESFSIPVSESLDGQTIRRSDYIAVEKKEG